MKTSGLVILILISYSVSAQWPTEISSAGTVTSSPAHQVRSIIGGVGFGHFNSGKNTVICGLFVPQLSVTALDESQTEFILVYPNPVSDQLFISTQSKRIKILLLDAQGQLLFDTVPIDRVVNMENFSNGMYFIRITDVITSKSQTIKIIKQ